MYGGDGWTVTTGTINAADIEVTGLDVSDLVYRLQELRTERQVEELRRVWITQDAGRDEQGRMLPARPIEITTLGDRTARFLNRWDDRPLTVEQRRALVWSRDLGYTRASRDGDGFLWIEIPGQVKAPWLTVKAAEWMNPGEWYSITEMLP
jgi:hypothetical protein